MEEEHEDTWWKRMVDKYGSVELENKGSVARDHLALGRWLLRSTWCVHAPLEILTLERHRTDFPRLAADFTCIREHRRGGHAAVPTQHVSTKRGRGRSRHILFTIPFRIIGLERRAAAQTQARGQTARSDVSWDM